MRIVSCLAVLLSFSLPAAAQEPLKIKPLAEKKVARLPAGELHWCIESMPSLEAAKAAAGEHALAAESAGKAWLLNLGARGQCSGAGMKVGEVGPIPRVEAATYLLRINEASGAPGAVTTVHSHPGSEAFFVLAGEQTIRGANGVLKVKAGHPAPGNGADMAMQVSSSGSEDLLSLVMFVVDAGRPFSVPAKLP